MYINLDERHDAIDNSVYNALCAMLGLEPGSESTEKEFPWNMEHIGEVADHIEEYLKEKGFKPCRPFYEDEVPCYQTSERCPWCKEGDANGC